MGEREDNVYKAKLAEQAERYDGKSFFDILLFLPILTYLTLAIARRESPIYLMTIFPLFGVFLIHILT